MNEGKIPEYVVGLFLMSLVAAVGRGGGWYTPLHWL